MLGQLMNLSPRLNTPDGADAASAGGGGAGAPPAADDYETLESFLAAQPVKDGDSWLRALASRAPRLASRVAAVRVAYVCDEAQAGFEWQNLRRLTEQQLRDGNLAVMRDWAAGAVLGRDAAADAGDGA